MGRRALQNDRPTQHITNTQLEHSSLYLLAIFMACCALVLAMTVTHVNDKLVGGAITISIATVVATVVYVVRACTHRCGMEWIVGSPIRSPSCHPRQPCSPPPTIIRHWLASPQRLPAQPSTSSCANHCNQTSAKRCSSGSREHVFLAFFEDSIVHPPYFTGGSKEDTHSVYTYTPGTPPRRPCRTSPPSSWCVHCHLNVVVRFDPLPWT